MSETQPITIDTEGLQDDLDEVRSAVTELVENDLNPLAETLDETFSAIGESITDSLSSAARTGRGTIRSMVNDILSDLSRLAAEELVRKPLEGVLGDIFGGARAGGGLVGTGTPYLVGERGPEMFVPSTTGQIAPIAGRPVTVNISMPTAGRDPLGRSEAQLARTVQRALTRALRNA